MKKIHKELLNDVLTGLLVAAAFAAALPADAFAQLSNAVTASGQQVVNPIITVANYASYGVGTVAVITGVAGAKKHADNPSSNPLGPALGKMGAGAAFLAAPSVIGMLESTGSNTFTGSGKFSTLSGVQ